MKSLPLKSDLIKGFFLMLLAALGIALQGAVVKYASLSLTTGTIFFGRALVAFGWAMLYMLPYLKKECTSSSLIKSKKKNLLFLRALCGAFAALILYYTLRLLSVSIATLLYLTFPIFVPIVARVWLKTKITMHIWWGLAIAFVGIILILDPSRHVQQGSWLVLLGLFSGLLGAVGSVANRILHRYVEQQKIVFTYFFVTLLIAIICLAIELLVSSVSFHLQDALFFLVIGSTGFGFQYCFSLALKYAPARLMTPCTYLSLVFTVIVDRVFWQNMPTLYQWMGIVGVVLGVALIMLSEPSA